MEKVSVVVVAAGSSSRMGALGNKQFLMLGDKPVLAHTLLCFSKMEEVSEIIVVTKADAIFEVQTMVKAYGIQKIQAVVPGGETRQDSVYNGLMRVQEEKVLIHDGARPFVRQETVRDVIAALDKTKAAVVGVPVKDTIKRVDGEYQVKATLPRNELVMIQTPQGFWTKEIIKAHQHLRENQIEVTDDAAAAEWSGMPVKIVLGDYWNIKITTPEDIVMAEGIVRYREEEKL